MRSLTVSLRTVVQCSQICAEHAVICTAVWNVPSSTLTSNYQHQQFCQVNHKYMLLILSVCCLHVCVHVRPAVRPCMSHTIHGKSISWGQTTILSFHSHYDIIGFASEVPDRVVLVRIRFSSLPRLKPQIIPPVS